VQLILISGLSGSGKSIALNVLEDSTYYCVDNLPATLLSDLASALHKSGYNRIAASIDVRSGKTLDQLPSYIQTLKERGVDVRVLFLDAKTDTLVKRFSETRRRHPLSDDRLTLTECIERERESLVDIANIGYRIDTSELSPNNLRSWIKDFVEIDRSRLTLLFQSFAFKHGIPLDADIVFDVRCLPNPHYDPVLRPLSGKDQAVVDFLAADALVNAMHNDIQNYIQSWLPSYIRDNRSYLTVAIGCTGGKHRSVYLVECLARYFKAQAQVLVRHRELV
jgi:RNase adapter protein RapZ